MIENILGIIFAVLVILYFWKDRHGNIIEIERTITGDGYPIHEDKFEIKRMWAIYVLIGIIVIRIIMLIEGL